MGSHPGLPSPINLTRLGGTLALALAVVAPVVLTLWVSTPDVSDVQLRVARLTRSYDVVLLRPDDVPKMLADAVIATEDERFYSHHGIDTVGLARAGLYDVANRCLCEGGSTITQQLVKQLYLNGSDRGYNKVVDMVLALKVEAILGKGQIMADYLSEIPTGVNRHGVADADRKSTRLNSSHSQISYAVFCLKKKTLSSYIDLSHSPFPELLSFIPLYTFF